MRSFTGLRSSLDLVPYPSLQVRESLAVLWKFGSPKLRRMAHGVREIVVAQRKLLYTGDVVLKVVFEEVFEKASAESHSEIVIGMATPLPDKGPHLLTVSANELADLDDRLPPGILFAFGGCFPR